MSSPRLLDGKVAAITGGLTGIGKAIALEYLRQGAFVSISHLGGDGEVGSLEEMTREAEEIVNATLGSTSTQKRFITVSGDISKPETGTDFVARTVEAFGGRRLDIFVSNAGVCQFEEFLQISPSLLNHTVTTNLSGAFFAVQAAARHMSTQSPSPGGSIIGISSISALVGGAQQTHYTPTKAGITSLMQSCAVALGKYGIRCNALLPGTIRTRLNEVDLRDEGKRAYMEGRVPLGRLGRTSDLAGPAVFLGCEQLSGYVVSGYCPLCSGIGVVLMGG